MFAVKYTGMSNMRRLDAANKELDIDTMAIEAAARTICLSFSDDPLIRWLRPGACRWKEMTPETMTWQRRRIQNAIIDGQVFAISEVLELKSTRVQAANSVDTSSTVRLDGFSIDAVAIVYPPHLTWTKTILAKIFSMWMVINDWLSPLNDNGGNKKVCGRL